MISAELFDKTLRAALQNDRHGVMHYLEEAVEIARSKNLKNDQIILDRLSASIGSSPRRQMSAQSSSVLMLTSRQDSTLYERYYPDVALDEIVLSDDKRQVVTRMLSEWEQREKLLEHGLYPNNRLLLHGPPGTGKTKLAKAIANYLNMELVYVRLDELISSYLGKTGKNIREIFDLAAKQDVVIFLDEVDTIAKQRDDAQELGELKRVVTVLLQNIDLLSAHSLLVAATNHAALLDSAIWRRFPYRLEMDMPGKKERLKLIRIFLGFVPQNLDVEVLVKLTEGLSGSDIHELVDKAKRQALINDSELDSLITLGVFATEIMKYKSDKKTRKLVYSIIASITKNGPTLYEVANQTGIPYTTLRDNVEGDQS